MNMKVLAQASTKVCIIIVNYEGWGDSIRCLESLFRLTGIDFDVVVCDNHSSDRSWRKIRSFVKSKIPDVKPPGRCFASGPTEAMRIEAVESYGPDPYSIAIIRTSENLGFGGGNNVGIRYALSTGDSDYIWLLNNDTVVDPNALSAMVKRMEAVPEAGMCGSTLLYQDDPHKIQSLGGARYLKWAGIGVQIGANGRWPAKVRADSIEKKLSYVSGASILVSRKFLETVGLMEEGYFLYFEEIDWARRAARRFKLAYAPDSIVYHKEGGSIGSSRSGSRRSPQSFFWLTRSRLLFTAKHHPEALPSVTLYSLINCVQWALLNRNPRIFLAGLKACANAARSWMRDPGVE